MPWYDIILTIAGTGAFLYYTITKTSSGFEIKSIDNELARLYKLKKNSDFYELEAIVSDGTLNGYFYCDSYYNCVYFDDNMIFTVKGIGCGYGMSLNTARHKANSGAGYEEILYYFYKNIELKDKSSE